jgi:hypothetical protein
VLRKRIVNGQEVYEDRGPAHGRVHHLAPHRHFPEVMDMRDTITRQPGDGQMGPDELLDRLSWLTVTREQRFANLHAA